MNDNLAEYIRQNRDDYTRDAINQQLRSAGYTSVEIGAAWRAVEGSRFSDPRTASPQEVYDLSKTRRFANSPRFWSIFVGFLLVSYLVPGVLVYTGIVSPGIGWLATFGLILFFALQIFAIVFGLINMERDRPTSMGLLISALSALLLLPFIGVVALYGICTSALKV